MTRLPASDILKRGDGLKCPDEVLRLVKTFQEFRSSYRGSGYKETEVRREFLDPFFMALGWDVSNTAGRGPATKDVVHEYTLPSGEEKRLPDYSFRIGGEAKFFVEAKKPSVDLKDGVSAALQIRSYAWSAQLPIGVLTDFEEFAIYDCRYEPMPGDPASTARAYYYLWKEYPDRWSDIAALLSRDAVLAGSLAPFDSRKRDAVSVDQAFLGEIETWRRSLAEGLARYNEALTQRQLNFAVQQTLDRIIFLRICEDRGIEPEGELLRAAKTDGWGNSWSVYPELLRLFLRADDKYNSGLFHFAEDATRSEAPDRLTPDLKVDDNTLRNIVRRLYFPESPYRFAVFPADILGQVYEQFLGKVIRLTPDHEAVIEEKPEVKKAGGVYYTPSHIVRHIIEATLRPLLDQTTIDQLATTKEDRTRVRVLDPACGSGSFLIEAYQFLLDWYRERYVEKPERWARGARPRIYLGPQDQWLLTGEERKRILLEHIFGVDIDSQAVEVTKLSLLLKVLEGETSESLTQQLQLIQQRALPDLAENVKCGNSLIDPAFFSEQGRIFSTDDHYRINAFNWSGEFPEVMEKGGFDAVVGNPPWLMAGYYSKDQLAYLKEHFESAHGKFDLYYLFIEQSCGLVRQEGRVGLIVPNKLFHTSSAGPLRKLLNDENWVDEVIDFGAEKVFPKATNYSCILTLRRDSDGPVSYSRATAALRTSGTFSVPRRVLEADRWYFHDAAAADLFESISAKGQPLASLVSRFGTGVQTGADTLLVMEAETASERKLEPALLRPLLRGRDVRRYWQSRSPRVVVFPYKEEARNFVILSPAELEVYPRVHEFLKQHRDKLAKRIWFDKSAEELSGHWYGLPYVDASWTFSAPHLLTPSLSDHANFARGSGNLFATGTAGVTSVIPSSSADEDLLYLLGLLNSELLSFFIISHSPIFSGGYFKFSAPYLKNVPIRPRQELKGTHRGVADALIEAVERAIEARRALDQVMTNQEQAIHSRQLLSAQTGANDCVYDLFEVSEVQRKHVVHALEVLQGRKRRSHAEAALPA